jgi:hypothetical protein
MRGRLLAAAVAAWLAAAPAAADVVFPARLDVTETELGRYEISFSLPMVEGRVLRAEPELPPACRDVSPRARSADSGTVTTVWSVVCEPPSLAGEAILVVGLLGTQTDLAFRLTTLDGRVFERILRPSRPGFLVPPPPSAAALAATAGVAGLRWALAQLPLWLLLGVAALAGARRRELAAGACAVALGAVVAQWLVGRGWLDVAAPVANAFVLLAAALPAVGLAGAGDRWTRGLRPLWPAALLAGALQAGAAADALSVEGLSDSERLAALLLFGGGAAAGAAWVAVVALQLQRLLSSRGGWRWCSRAAGYAIGAAAAGLLIANGVALVLLASDLPLGSLDLILIAAALGPLTAAASSRGWMVAAFAAVASLGLAGGIAPLAMPFDGLAVTALLLAVGTPLALARLPSSRLAPAVAALATVACSWSATTALVDNVSRSIAAATAMVLAATAVGFVSVRLAVGLAHRPVPLAVRAVGIAVVLWAVVGRLVEYRGWYEREVATDAALGVLRVPVLALALVLLAALLWPRRRRVLEQLGVRRRRPVGHLVALAAAFLAVPYGTAAVPDPTHLPEAPRGDAARRVVSAVLLDTYLAFNLADESEVYDRLSANLTGDLVEDLYLDSRRRLTAGTREGSEVTVRGVEVLDIGEPTEVGAGAGTFTYGCRWAVTARVRHLQHVHHRRNIYGGELTLTNDAGHWKIARVELASEDRELVTAPPG